MLPSYLCWICNHLLTCCSLPSAVIIASRWRVHVDELHVIPTHPDLPPQYCSSSQLIRPLLRRYGLRLNRIKSDFSRCPSSRALEPSSRRFLFHVRPVHEPRRESPEEPCRRIGRCLCVLWRSFRVCFDPAPKYTYIVHYFCVCVCVCGPY